MQNIASMLLGILVHDSSDRDGWRCINGTWHQGMRMEYIGDLRGVSAAQRLKAMKHLVSLGLVKRTGNTRGTRYQAVGL